MSLFPALAVSYYSNKKGLKAELGSDRLLGVPLETYIPSEKLAIESVKCRVLILQPAYIDYANEQAKKENLNAKFICQDIRTDHI